jgi:hypothetical protein
MKATRRCLREDDHALPVGVVQRSAADQDHRVGAVLAHHLDYRQLATRVAVRGADHA